MSRHTETRPLPAVCVPDLAARLARSIISEGDGPTPCQRIEFKGGTYPDEETAQGGYCEEALAKHIRKFLNDNAKSR